jgi:hypothetical protein
METTDQVAAYLPDLVRTALPVDGHSNPTAEYIYIRNSEEPLGTLALIRNTGSDAHLFVTTYPVCWDGAREGSCSDYCLAVSRRPRP